MGLRRCHSVTLSIFLSLFIYAYGISQASHTDKCDQAPESVGTICQVKLTQTPLASSWNHRHGHRARKFSSATNRRTGAAKIHSHNVVGGSRFPKKGLESESTHHACSHTPIMQATPALLGDGKGCYRIHVTGNSGMARPVLCGIVILPPAAS